MCKSGFTIATAFSLTCTAPYSWTWILIKHCTVSYMNPALALNVQLTTCIIQVVHVCVENKYTRHTQLLCITSSTRYRAINYHSALLIL